MTNAELAQLIQLAMKQNQQPVVPQQPVTQPVTPQVTTNLDMFKGLDLGQLLGGTAQTHNPVVPPQTVQQPQPDVAQLVQNEVSKVLGQMLGGLSALPVTNTQTQQNQPVVNPYAQALEQLQKQQKEATYINMNEYIAKTGQVPNIGEKTLEQQVLELQQQLADKNKLEEKRQLEDTLKLECYKLGYTPKQADYLVNQVKDVVKVDPSTGSLVNVQEQLKSTFETIKSVVEPSNSLGSVVGAQFNPYNQNQTPPVTGSIASLTDQELDDKLF